MSETSAGSILGTLRLSITDFEAGIAKAQALADNLDRDDVNVKVRADTGGAEAKLAAVAASEDKVDQGNKKVAKSGHDAGKGMGALATAIITLGPAIVPLAAGTAGLAVGFGAMGAAGVLSIVGIAKEMKTGSTMGNAYVGMVGTLKGNLDTLSHTAATGVLRPFQVAVADLQTKMPALNGIIGQFSAITGKTAGVLTTGLVAAFIALAPLARDAGVYVLSLSQRFAGLMSGGGVTAFGDYVRSVFPQVMQTVESVVTAAVRLVAALAPLGAGTLGILRTFADVINAIPVDVLAALAQTASSVYIGFKSFGVLAIGIRAVGTALEYMGVSAETAAVGLGALNIAAGVIAAVIAVATFAYSKHAEAARQDQEAVNTLTDALTASNGVIDQNIRHMTSMALGADGSRTAYRELGGTLSDLTSAALGNVPAQEKVNGVLVAAKKAADEANTATTGSGPAWAKRVEQINLVRDSMDGSNATLKKSTQAWKDDAAATASGTAATQAATPVQAALALANMNAATATDTQKTAINALNTAMDAELSRALQLAGATSGYDQALLTMNTTLKKNNGTLSQHTQAGISDRQSIEAVVGSLQSQRDAQIKNGATVAVATAKYQTNSAALLAQVGRLNGTKSAAYAYMKQLLAIPKSVQTVIDANKNPAEAKVAAITARINAIRQGKVPGITANTAAGQAAIAALQRQIDVLHGKAVTIQVQTFTTRTNTLINRTSNVGPIKQANGAILNAFANGGIRAFANGNILNTGIRAFANGGENHVAQIAPAGAMRLWAEPETGGEAYIPLAPSKRARSQKILSEVAHRFGNDSSPATVSAPMRTIILKVDGREMTRVVLDGMDNIISGGLTRVGVS